MVHKGVNYPMATQETRVRRSVSLPAPIAKRVKAIARTKKTSANRVIVDLIESGLEAQEQERKRLFELADQLARSKSPSEQQQLKDELARLVFGA